MSGQGSPPFPPAPSPPTSAPATATAEQKAAMQQQKERKRKAHPVCLQQAGVDRAEHEAEERENKRKPGRPTGKGN